MRLAIPGTILEIQEQQPMPVARLQIGESERQVSLDFVPEATIGDYVMVHVGFVISRVDACEAVSASNALQEMEMLEDVSGGRQFEGKYGAAAQLAGNADNSVMSFDDGLDDS